MAKKNLVYNVERSVGRNGVNQADDVLLVRFFLRRISEVPQFNSPYRDMSIVPSYDSTLGDAILWFQKMAKSKGKNITVDGRVDPAPKGDGLYTIIFMNGNYWKYFPRYKHYIEADPLFPPQLTQALDQHMPYYI